MITADLITVDLKIEDLKIVDLKIMQPGTPILVVYKDDDMFSGSFPATILKKGKNNCYSVQWSEGEHKGTITHNVHISNISMAQSKAPCVDLTLGDSDSEVAEPPRKRLKSHDTLDDYKVFTSGEENLEEDSVSEASIKSFDMAITNDDTSKESNMSCPHRSHHEPCRRTDGASITTRS